mmetsp:Transcript_4964/g.11470  ORF Transcript_4964/g.11470 Transcript_4964/m.11470 type:complete len:233 (+) Transcript_4964:50-748(+)
MAAVLCNGISKICSGTCEAVGTILSLPCKACGMGCGSVSTLCRSPFCLYTSVTLGLNIPAIVFAARVITYDFEGGCRSASDWLKIDALLCFVNIIAAFYIAAKIAYDPPESGTTNQDSAPYVEATIGEKASNKTSGAKSLTRTVMEFGNLSETRGKSLSRVKEVLCYDPIVAFYIIVGIGFMVWQSIGVGRNQLAENCGGNLSEYIGNSLICGFCFIMFGGMSFAISVCCMK